MEIVVLQIGSRRLSGGMGHGIGEDTQAHAGFLLGDVGHLSAQSERFDLVFGDLGDPDLALDLGDERSRGFGSVDMTFFQNDDIVCDVFDVGNDVRGDDDDLIEGDLRNVVAHGDTLFGIQSRRRLVED